MHKTKLRTVNKSFEAYEIGNQEGEKGRKGFISLQNYEK